jgi:ribose 5-phosphate isomerase B
MRINVSSDEYTELTRYVLAQLADRGHDVTYFGPREGSEPGADDDWPLVTVAAVSGVVDGSADEAIVMCWTGTGAALAANKVPGIRAALVGDAVTAAGARKWNHANVLALSLRATPLPIASEILDAWFNTPYTDDDWNLKQIRRIRDLESRNLNE